MKKLLIWATVFFMGATVAVQAQSIIMERNGKERRVKSIQVSSNGDLRFTEGESNIQSMLRKNAYLWAWVPKPASIANADELLKAGEYVKAVAAYKAEGEKYSLLGWDVYCILKQAEAMVKNDKKGDAVKILEPLSSYKLVNQRLEKDLMAAYQLLVNTYIELGEISKATPYLDKMALSTDENVASFAFIKKGDVKAQGSDKMDAALEYFQAALLFPKSKERPEALFKSAQILRELKDARAEKFAEILKKEYPSDPYAKQLQ